LYISTLTVGRKLTECICRRAVCCRMGEYNQSIPSKTSTQNTSAGYRINHPAILGTAVYMDESGAVETNSETRGQDVRFHSSLSWAWWRIPADSESSPINNQLECIDGSTGFLVTSGSGEDVQPSKLCTWAMIRIFLKARAIDQNTNEDAAYSTLSSLCKLKQDVSPHHESTKDMLLSKHRVLRQWNRRSSAIP
jgi:hypothetical protein